MLLATWDRGITDIAGTFAEKRNKKQSPACLGLWWTLAPPGSEGFGPNEMVSHTSTSHEINIGANKFEGGRKQNNI